MKSVLISIQPKWCKLIASGKKTIEVRKSKPQLDTPFKCYMYETKEGRGKVIGEFICDKIVDAREVGATDFYSQSQMTYEEFRSYTDTHKGNVYVWYILSPKMYKEPKDLMEFTDMQHCPYGGLVDCKECENRCIQRAPMSWRYVDKWNRRHEE